MRRNCGPIGVLPFQFYVVSRWPSLCLLGRFARATMLAKVGELRLARCKADQAIALLPDSRPYFSLRLEIECARPPIEKNSANSTLKGRRCVQSPNRSTNFYMSLRSIQSHLRRCPARLALESFRNKLHCISIPLPRPAAHEIVVLGGRAGEREGQVETKIP